MRPDLVLLSARLLDPHTGRLLPHTALSVSDGLITRIADDDECRAQAGSGTTVIDLGGAVLTPL